MRIVFFDGAPPAVPAEVRALMRQCRRRGDLVGVVGEGAGLAPEADVLIRLGPDASPAWRARAVSAWCQRFGIEAKDTYCAIGSCIVPWEPSV